MLLSSVVAAIGCAKDKSTNDYKADVSRQAVSEQGLNDNGCAFAVSDSKLNLLCASDGSALEKYQRLVALYRYQIAAIGHIKGGSAYTKSGTLINANSVRKIYEKWLLASKNVNGSYYKWFCPDLVVNAALRPAKFENDVKVFLNALSLSFLSEIMVSYNFAAVLDGDQLSIDVTQFDGDRLPLVKELFVNFVKTGSEYLASHKDADAQIFNVVRDNMSMALKD